MTYNNDYGAPSATRVTKESLAENFGGSFGPEGGGGISVAVLGKGERGLRWQF